MTATHSYSTDDTTNRGRVLALLSDKRWHSTLELQAVGGSRAPARVFELRREGWVIACEGERGRFNYLLVEWQPPKPRPLSWRRRALIAEARVAELEKQLRGH